MAESAAQAIRKDKLTPVEDCWVDDEWKKKQIEELRSAIGFLVDNQE